MKSGLIRVLKIALPLGFGIGILWYFYGVMEEKGQVDQFLDVFSRSNYVFIGLSILCGITSHLSRAWRWKYLLEPMGYRPTFMHSFHSIMAGYIINLGIPRAGEISRASSLGRTQGIPFEKAFGSIFAERVVDLLMMGMVFLLTIFAMGKRWGELLNLRDEHSAEHAGGTNWWLYGALAAVVLIVGILYLKSEKLRAKIKKVALGFLDGLKTIWTMKKRLQFLGHTVLIWFLYVFMFWVALLSIEETQSVGFDIVMGGFFMGAAAMVLAPGGLGLYPVMVAAFLVKFGVVPESSSGVANGLGTLIWVSQTLLILVFGIISLVWLSVQLKRNGEGLNVNSAESSVQD